MLELVRPGVSNSLFTAWTTLPNLVESHSEKNSFLLSRKIWTNGAVHDTAVAADGYYSRCGRVDLCNTLFVKAGEKMTMENPPKVTETEYATLTGSPDVRPRPVCPEIGGKCMTGIC